jgi:aldose 1-epimerase
MIEYEAVSDADTYVNLTNHCYFNLAGHDSGDIHGHHLQLFAAYYTPIDHALIPLGEIAPVLDTPFDFLTEKPIGRDIDADYEQIRRGGGYDHNFVLKKPERNALSLAARVKDPISGRKMEVWTTLPGIQLYTANMLTNRIGKDGAKYGRRGALCLETQFFPDSMSHTHFPSPVLFANQRSCSRTEYRFI